MDFILSIISLGTTFISIIIWGFAAFLGIGYATSLLTSDEIIKRLK